MIRSMVVRAALVLLALAGPLRAETAIQEVTSPGGIKAWLVEDHNIAFSALELRFKGGTSLDLPGKRGAVNLMAALIEEGAGEMDAQGFANARDGLAAQFSFGSDQDGVSVSAQFLTENRDQAIDLLRQALTQPRFDQDAVDRVRGQVMAGLRDAEQDPSTIAEKATRARNFGDHPYASMGDGTLDSVPGLTRDDVAAAYKGALARDRVYVSAAGDISAAELGVILDQLLGDLPATGLPMPPRAVLLEKGGIAIHPFPGPQSVVQFGQGGLRFDDPDFFAASLMNEILGGSRFSARLMNEVREKRGLTYGISTGLAIQEQTEELLGQFAASNDKVAEAIKVVQDEWAKILADGVTEKELADAKTFMTGSYPLRFDGNGRIASILVGMQMLNLPVDYPQTRNARIEAVTMADIQRVTKRLIKPENLFFTVVGSPVGLTATE